MRYSDKIPVVNAGSMADIAFLLLIFFLVSTTIPNDKGIIRKLPAPCPTKDCDIELNERNVFRITLNESGELLNNNELVAFKDLKANFKKFIDNNGDSSCDYCQGEQVKGLSDNPQEATIVLTAHRNVPYQDYIMLQDELTKAYEDLRKLYVRDVLKSNMASLSNIELKKAQLAYPLRITEATIK